MILAMTPLFPASAVIILLQEVASIGDMVLKMKVIRAIFFSWNVKVARRLELLGNAGV